MRFTLLSGVVLAVFIVWLLAARSLTLLLDRVHLARITSNHPEQIRYDNGVIEVAGVRLDTLTTETMPSGLKAVLSEGGRVFLMYQGRSFPCGPGRSLSPQPGLPDIAFSPDPGDTAVFTTERGHAGWPTPLAMNFMTGSAPSWKRHLYCRLSWTKRSRGRLEILWRFEQGYFKPDGWRPQTIDYGSAGLFRVRITEGN